MAGSWASQGQAKGHGAQGEGWRGEVAWGWLDKNWQLETGEPHV